MKFLHHLAFLLFVSAIGFGICSSAADQATSSDQEATAADDEEARQRVLHSSRWIKARIELRKWLSMQSIYTDEQIHAIESEMRNKIDLMTAEELKVFLAAMEDKLRVLMSPAAADARSWVKEYYTKEVQHQMAKKYGVEDPIRLSANEIEAALSQFYADRQTQLAESASFDHVRESQVKAAREYKSTQQKARAQAAQQSRNRPAPYSTSYAPRKNRNPQVYRSKYPGPSYSIGPWGGVWMHR